MYCQGCGKEVPEDGAICLGCGRELKKTVKPWSTAMVVIYCILAVIIPFVGIVAGIIGTTKEQRRTQGIVILAASVLGIFFWGFIMG